MRIAAIDLETKPGLAYFWRTGQQFVSLDMVKEHTELLCYAVRWNDRKKTEFYSDWEHGRQEMAVQAHRILDEADAILHFNGKRFDTPWLRSVLQRAGLKPPSPFKEIDLYQQTKQFELVSHKLQNVSTRLVDAGGKVQTGGMSLWKRVIAGDVKAQALMRRYNIQDVDVLWTVFDELRPWLKLPNAQLYGARQGACPSCGSDRIQSRGVETTLQSTFQRFQCQACSKWFRSTARLSGANMVGVAV